MGNIVEIKIPNLGPNDEYAYLTEWYVKDEDYVNVGNVLFNVETTKSNIDIESEAMGYVYILEEEAEQELKVGKVVALISTDKLDKFQYKKSSNIKQNLFDIYHLTKKAKSFVEENGIQLGELDLAKDKIYSEREIQEIVTLKSNPNEQDNKYYLENSQSIIIYGGGGHAKMCIDILKQIHNYKIIGIVDNILKKGDYVLGVPVLGDETILSELRNKGINKIVLGIGAIEDPFIREKIYFELKELGFEFPNIIHPRAIIEPSVKLGEGNQIMASAVIGSNVQLGNNNIINSNAVVSHDCIVKNSVHITPGAVLAGRVQVNNCAVIGMSSTIYLKLEIGSKAIIHNNCRVTRNVANNEIVKSDI